MEDFTDISHGDISKKTISQSAPVFVFTAIKILHIYIYIFNNVKLVSQFFV